VTEHAAVIIGAGPAGLACAAELSRIPIDAAIVERGCLTQAIYAFPEQMRFFSESQSLEIPGIPWRSRDRRPARAEALQYYSGVARALNLEIHQRESVAAISGSDGAFRVRTTVTTRKAAKVIIATGFYGQPNLLGVPGESLPKVTHYYRDAHPYLGCEVAVIGGRNSAGIVAADLAGAGARVTLIHRGECFGMKPWIASTLENEIASGHVEALMTSQVQAILDHRILVKTPAGSRMIPNEFVFAMTGYHPDLEFLAANGIALTSCGSRPLVDPETLESGRPGIYLAGTVVAGTNTGEMNIETARLHGAKIAAALRGSLRAAA